MCCLIKKVLAMYLLFVFLSNVTNAAPVSQEKKIPRDVSQDDLIRYLADNIPDQKNAALSALGFKNLLYPVAYTSSCIEEFSVPLVPKIFCELQRILSEYPANKPGDLHVASPVFLFANDTVALLSDQKKLLGESAPMHENLIHECEERESGVVIINTSHFESNWAISCKNVKEKMKFLNINRESLKKVAAFRTMTCESRRITGMKKGRYQIFGLPLQDGYKMYIIFPSKGEKPEDIIRNPELFREIVTPKKKPSSLYDEYNRGNQGRKKDFFLVLPKFSISQAIDISDYIQAFFDSPFFLTKVKVKQSTVIRVDENGLMANPMANVEEETMISPEPIEINAPFGYLVVDRNSNIILSGTVYDPQYEDE